MSIRHASSEMITFYEEKLYPLQDKVFDLLQSDKFYLTGGTCLSRFYYQHRFSDDLDFFFNGDQYNKELFDKEADEMTKAIRNEFQIEFVSDTEYFKRFFIIDSKVKLRVDFVMEHYPVLGEQSKHRDMIIDSKLNIVVNKLTTVYDRKTTKDYIDLYYLLQDFQLKEILPLTKKKIVPLDYEGVVMALSNGELEGDVYMKKPVDEQDLIKFVNDLKNKLIEYARSL